MRQSLPVYAPQSLFNLNDALGAKRDHIKSKVLKLEETQSLTEVERQAVIEFTDRLHLTRWPKYWEHMLATRNPARSEHVPANAKLAARSA